MTQVFISYSRKDIKFARRLAGDLEKAGFDVWWDISDLKGGDDWVRFIPAAIEASQYVLVLLSPDSIQSEWVEREYSYAIRQRKKLIPAMIKPCAVPFSLHTINYVDFVNLDYATGVNKVLDALGGAPQPDIPLSRTERVLKKLPAPVARYSSIIVGALIILLAFALYSLFKPSPPPVTPTPSATPSSTSTWTAMPPTATNTATPTQTITYTPTISPTPTLTRTKTPVPVNFVLPTVCVQPEPDIHSVYVRTGPGTDLSYLKEAPAMEVGKCPLIGGRNEEDTWFMIAYDQPDPEFIPYEGGWIRKDLFNLSTPVFIPEITLTPTPTITSTFTVTVTSSPTWTPTFTPTRTFIPITTDTPTLEPEPTNTPLIPTSC